MTSTILLVEDEAAVAMEQARMLERHGYRVITAHSGEQALEEIKTHSQISLTLIDLDLGRGMDGSRTAQLLLQRREMPVVFLTAHSEKEYVDKAKEVTNYGYVLKSSGEFVLLESIHMAFKLFAAHRQGREQERKYRLIAENSTEMITTTDNQHHPTYVSPAVTDLLGYTQEEYLQLSSEELLTPASYQRVLETYRSRPSGDMSSRRSEIELIRKDGSTLWCEALTKPLLDEEGRRIGTIVSIRDISRRKEVETKLQKSEERYRLLAEHSTDVIAHFDSEFRPLYISPSIEELTEYRAEDFRQNSVFDILPPEDRSALFEQIQQSISARRRRSTRSFRIVTQSGKQKWVEVSAKLLYGSTGSIEQYVIVARDITARKAYEQKNEERKQHMEAVLKADTNAIVTLDTQNRINEWNPGAEELFGFTREEALGCVLNDLIGGGDIETIRETRRNIEQVNRGKPVQHSETIRYTKAGDPINVIVAGAPIVVGKNFRGIVASYTDITPLKRKEQRVETLLKEKEQLLQEVHHRIKNHMNTISSIISLHSAYVEETKSREILAEVQNRIGIMQNLYQRLYTSDSVESVPLSSFLHELLHDIETTYMYGNSITVLPQIEELTISARQSLPVGIIVTELITNAVKYAFDQRHQGTITVAVQRRESGELHIEVADDGRGIPAEMLATNFYGFGLTLVQGYVDQFNGELQIDATQGTRITITFPLEETG